MRERLAFSSNQIRAALASLRAYADEGFIFSTCNRVEIGGVAADPEALVRFLAEWHHVAPADLMPYLYTLAGDAAVRHVFRLAAGLDSIVLGEDQIVAQVKAALADARAAGLAGQRVTRLLSGALAVGKLVRTRTEIARSHLSTVSVALDIARQELGDMRQLNVVVVGAGRIAELALKHLRGDPPRSTLLLNRTFERARALAPAYGAQALPFEHLQEALRRADVVLSATASPTAVIAAGMVERAMRERAAPRGPATPHGPATRLLLLDLAVPRDVDPAAADIPGVKLFGIDDLKPICEANRAGRAGAVAAAEELIAAEVAKFVEWWQAQEVVPTIRALRERAESIRRAEVDRTLARLPHLSEREQAAVQAMTAAIVNKLLHQPIATLKDAGGDAQLALAVQELFRL
jgi:glutamyl-tRNA reductase